MRVARRVIPAVLAFFCATSLGASEGYLRHPALRGDTVVFTAEGDLWSVPATGGLARRLTSHPAEETQAAISPDGREIAFVASYDDAPDIYAMPIDGGSPRRLSFLAGRVFLQGYDQDYKLWYSSDNTVGPTNARILRTVDPDTLETREWPLSDVADASLSADGKLLWFTQFGLAITNDNARHYRGGAMARLFRIDAELRKDALPIGSQLNINLASPLAWREGAIVTSDADGIANLWWLSHDGSERRSLTQHRDFEVRGAAIDGDRVIYQHGADLRILDLTNGDDRRLDIRLVSDFDQRRPRVIKNPLDFVQSINLAHDGGRLAISARGRVALAGLGALRRVDIDAPGTLRLRAAVLAADGRSVFAVVDAGRGSAIHRFATDGSGKGERLAEAGDEYFWRLYPDPKGRHLAYDDKQGRLWLLNLKTGKSQQIDRSPHAQDDVYTNVVWSPDGNSLAVVRPNSARLLNQLLVIDVLSEPRVHPLTSDRYESFDPAFSRDGQWLYFFSNRNFQTQPGGPWGDRNTGPGYDRRTKLYALALQAKIPFPFAPPDELTETDTNGQATDAKDVPSQPIEYDGLAERLFEVPLPPGNYSSLSANSEHLYFLNRAATAEAKPELKVLAIAPNSEARVFAGDVLNYQLSADARKLLLVKAGSDPTSQAPGKILIVDASASAPEDSSKAEVMLSAWQLMIDPVQEWQQMFDDAWRMHRQFSFDPAMRGVDWDEVRERYVALLPRVSDRAELDDLLAQMSSEVGLLHSQVRGADYRKDPDAVSAAALGAMIGVDRSGLYVASLYRGEFELPSERGPLAQPGVDVYEGDRIRAINGREVRTLDELVRGLAGRSGQQTLIGFARGEEDFRRVVVPVTVDRDAQLRYGDWVQRTRAKVEAGADGEIGYLHLRQMGSGDMASFVREFYANVDRAGLIIDVRRNRGGNIDAWVIEKLLKRAWAFWQPPGTAPYWNMQQSFRGHLVVLADQLTYSDGETFAAGVKALGLGPVIGMRTAGAGIWLSDRNRLADNGVARIAEFGQFDQDGRWMIEGFGVEPDIAIDNPPLATGRGGDAQLDAAIAELKRRMAAEPVVQPPAEIIPPLGKTGRG